MNIKLAENIKSLRAERGLSQKELATRLSVSPQAISRWENGLAYPDMEMLPRLADIFQVSVDRLFGRENSFIAQKEEELHAAWSEVAGDRDFRHLQIVCNILEELAAHGKDQLEFFRVARRLENDGFIKPLQVERARQYCREMLDRMDADERIAWLLDILPCESEEKWDLWRAYVPLHKMIADWDDVLFEQYPSRSEKKERQRQVVLCRAIEKLLDRHSYQHSRVALDTLDVYSKEAGDIFLCHRISLETTEAAALFGQGRTEDGFELLTKVLEHLRLIIDLVGTNVRGSIPALSLIEHMVTNPMVTFSIAGVCNIMTTFDEFDMVKNDARFVSFCREVNTVRPNCYMNIGKEESERLDQVLLSLQEQACTLNEEEQLMALITSRGEVYQTVLHNDAQQPPAISLSGVAKGTRARYLIILDRYYNTHLPSDEIMDGLIDPDEANQNVLLLFKHGDEYATMKLNRILERMRETTDDSESDQDNTVKY